MIIIATSSNGDHLERNNCSSADVVMLFSQFKHHTGTGGFHGRLCTCVSGTVGSKQCEFADAV